MKNKQKMHFMFAAIIAFFVYSSAPVVAQATDLSEKDPILIAQLLPTITLPPIVPTIVLPTLPPVAIPTITLPPLPINLNQPTSAPQPTSTNVTTSGSTGTSGGTSSTTTQIHTISERSNSQTTTGTNIPNGAPSFTTLDIINKKGVLVLDKGSVAKGRIVLTKEITEVIFGRDSLTPNTQPLVFVMPPERGIAILFNFGVFLTNDSAGVQHVILPQAIRMEQSSEDDNVSITLPQNEDISLSSTDCGDDVWDGTFTGLMMLPSSAVSIPGKNVGVAIEIGRNDCRINLSKQANILFVDKTDWQSGYRFQNQEKVTEIVSLCPVQNHGECVSHEGKNLIVKTPHFTQFVTFKKTTLWDNILSMFRDNNIAALAMAAVATLFFALILGNFSVLRKIGKVAEIDKQKSDYVSMVSHELRTPLTAIKGFISMILGGDYGRVQEPVKKPLEAVKTSSQRALNLVNDVLDVSRIESGKIDLNLVTFPIDTLISEVVTFLKPIAQEKKLTLEAASLDKMVVQADLEKVRQLIINLISNAIKYTDHGSIAVTTKENKEVIVIAVTDTGTGIPKEDQKKLFSKFERINTKHEGTGLGLYISRQLARRMGGDVWLEKSESGVGSTFGLSLLKADTPLAKKMAKKIENKKS